MATYEEISNRILADEFVQNILNKTDLSTEEQFDLIYHIVQSFSGIKRNTDKFYSKKLLPNDYVVFDIETTGLSKNDQIIQIAAVKVKNNKIINEFNSYVRLEDKELPIQIAYLTGITEEILEGAPSWEEVSTDFIEFIEDLPLIGHNAATFDIPFIFRTGLDLRHRLTVDTCEFARQCPLKIDNNKLDTLKEHYNIETVEHNALEDAKATHQIYEFLRQKDYAPRNPSKEFHPIFEGLKFAYTGSFKQFTRKNLEFTILSNYGKVNKTVTPNTNYLIVGTQLAKNLTDGVHSSKELKCMELIEKGNPIKMISEDEFIDMIKNWNNSTLKKITSKNNLVFLFEDIPHTERNNMGIASGESVLLSIYENDDFNFTKDINLIHYKDILTEEVPSPAEEKFFNFIKEKGNVKFTNQLAQEYQIERYIHYLPKIKFKQEVTDEGIKIKGTLTYKESIYEIDVPKIWLDNQELFLDDDLTFEYVLTDTSNIPTTLDFNLELPKQTLKRSYKVK